VTALRQAPPRLTRLIDAAINLRLAVSMRSSDSVLVVFFRRALSDEPAVIVEWAWQAGSGVVPGWRFQHATASVTGAPVGVQLGDVLAELTRLAALDGGGPR
jgi:hypothetical protein